MELGKQARILVVSASSDMDSERDLLAGEVFPQLRGAFEGYGVELIDIDPRWRKPPRAVDRVSRIEAMLRQVEECDIALCLVGERYGWIPPDLPTPVCEMFPEETDLAGKSLFELQILRALDLHGKHGRMLVYLRDSRCVGGIVDPSRARQFLESEESSRHRLAALENRVRDSGLPGLDGYPARWEEDRVGGLKGLAEHLREELWEIVSRKLDLPPQAPGNARPPRGEGFFRKALKTIPPEVGCDDRTAIAEILPHLSTEADDESDGSELSLGDLEHEFGTRLVRSTLGLLASSWAGLREWELAEILAEEPGARDLFLLLRRVRPRLRLGVDGSAEWSPSFFRAVHDRYLSNPSLSKAVHLRLAAFFEHQQQEAEELAPICWHLAQAEAWKHLGRLLSEPRFFLAAWNSDPHQLQADFERVQQQARSSAPNFLASLFLPILAAPEESAECVRPLIELFEALGQTGAVVLLREFCVRHCPLDGDLRGLAEARLREARSLPHKESPAAARLYRQAALGFEEIGDESALLLALEGEAEKRLASGWNQNALELYDRILERTAGQAHHWSQRGLALGRLEQHGEALASFDRALELVSEDPRVWIWRGSALSALERHDEALDSYRRALALEPDDIVGWNELGGLLWDLGRFEEALEILGEAVFLNPYDSWAWGAHADCLRRLGHLTQAVRSFDQVLHLEPDNEAIWKERGDILFSLGLYQEALASYQRVVGGSIDLHVRRAQAFLKLKLNNEAFWASDAALRSDPDCLPALQVRGIALARFGEAEEALAILDRVLPLDPEVAEVWSARGLALSFSKRYELSLESYDRALELDSENAAVWYDRGSVLSQLRRFKEAMASQRRGLELDPKLSELTFRQLGRVLSKRTGWSALKRVMERLRQMIFRRVRKDR